jgi:hypothetical protein
MRPVSYPSEPEEEIACAANRYPDIGVFPLPAPARHHHIMWTYLMIFGSGANRCEQGFLTTKGRFVDRIEGLRIAQAADQLLEKCGDPTRLFSEDLWPTPPEAAMYSIVKLDEDD